MFDFSPVKILLIAVVTIALLGPDKLPAVAQAIGSFWQLIRKWQSRVESEVRDIIPDLPDSAQLASYARSPLQLLNQLAEHATPEGALGSDESPSESPAPVMLTPNKPMVNPVEQTLRTTAPFDPTLN